jgi:hypothetical protein
MVGWSDQRADDVAQFLLFEWLGQVDAHACQSSFELVDDAASA